MNRSAHRRPRAIAIARAESESRQLAFRLTAIAAGAVAALIALFTKVGLFAFALAAIAVNSRHGQDASAISA